MERIVARQEFYCNGCDNYIQFALDPSNDGNYKINCPRCGGVLILFFKTIEMTEPIPKPQEAL